MTNLANNSNTTSYVTNPALNDAAFLLPYVSLNNKQNYEYDEFLIENIDFTKKWFSHLTFSDCTFVDCNFTQADMQNTIFTNCTFIDCNFTKANLTNSDLNDSEFKNCDLTDSILDNVDSNCASYTDCNVFDVASFSDKNAIAGNTFFVRVDEYSSYFMSALTQEEIDEDKIVYEENKYSTMTDEELNDYYQDCDQ